MEKIITERLVLRGFEEKDHGDLFEFLYQLKDNEFEGYPGITYENCENIYFHKDKNGDPIWKDTYIYAIIK